VFSIDRECKNTLDKLFEKIGIYSEALQNSIDEEDQFFFKQVLEHILPNILSAKRAAREATI